MKSSFDIEEDGLEYGEDFIEQVFADCYKPAAAESIKAWARREVELDPTSPIPGPYRIENSPQMGEPLDVWQDKNVRLQVTIGPNQGGRTKGVEVGAIWACIHRPGPMQYNTDTNDKAADFGEKRFWPMAESVTGFSAIMPNVSDRRKRGFIFRNGMPFSLQGANETNLQQDSIHTQINDEIYKWRPGMLGQAHKRCNVSYAATHKIWDVSIPGEEGHELYEEWGNSTRGEWSFCCRECGRVQRFKFGGRTDLGGLKWDTNETTRPGGEWDFDALGNTVRYECESAECEAVYSDTKKSRDDMNATGRYVHAAPNKRVVGHRYNVLSVNFPGIRWATWVEEFLRANEHYKQYGSTEKLMEFWTRRMAEFWEESRYCNPVDSRLKSDYALGVPSIYITHLWEDEWGRFLSIDKQEMYYRGIIRAVKRGGDSRLIGRFNLSSYDEISAKAQEFRVLRNRVLIDAKFEMREVFGECVKRGWTAFMGSDKPTFTHRVEVEPGKFQYVKRPYSEMQWGDPSMGKREQERNRRHGIGPARYRLARFFEWCNLPIKNLLSALKQGRTRIYWGVPEDIPEEYIAQINSEVRYRKLSKGGVATDYWSNRGRDGKGNPKPNHDLDAECQILAAMAMQGLIDLDRWEEVETPFEETA